MFVSLDKPSKLEALTNLLITKNNNFFYKASKGKVFTLPPGEYNFKGLFFVIDFNYSKRLNLKQPDFIKPKDFIYFYGSNPHKASVWENGLMLIDRNFKDVQILDLLLKLHEVAHSFYLSELDCDLFSIEVLKNYGYNDSQIIAALKTIGETERFKCIHNKLKIK